ncbi:Dnah7 [Symbiodinium sp. CCMP2456]|nr:Dnah7 [Symbiodinium sp. CCMP2456]
MSESNFLRTLELGIQFGKWILPRAQSFGSCCTVGDVFDYGNIRQPNKPTSKNLLRNILKEAAAAGAPQAGAEMWLENIGLSLDPALEPILQQQKVRDGSGFTIKLGDKSITYADTFKFFMTTTLPNPHYSPETSVKVTLLNFAITPTGLEDQMLGIVVAKERPDLEEQKSQLVKDNAKMNKQLKEIEDEILHLLSASEGDVLDDDTLVDKVTASKQVSLEIGEKQEVAKVTEVDIDNAREHAMRGAKQTAPRISNQRDLEKRVNIGRQGAFFGTLDTYSHCRLGLTDTKEFLSGKLGKAKAKAALDEEAQIVAVECSVDGQGQRLLCTTSKQSTYTFEIPCTGAPQDQPVKRVEASAGKQISHLTFKDWKLESAKVCELEVSLQEATSLVSDIEERVQGKISELKSEAGQEDDASSGEGGEDELRDLQLRMQKAKHCLTEGLQERAVEARLLLLAFLGSENVLFLGPPGTAKSLLARRMARVCGGQYFERLLTRFSVPEEVFGPLSLKALENDKLKRNVDGFLPDADVAFLDEVFKANSAILNCLLTLLNERVFDNGDTRIEVPLKCVVAASNELFEGDELAALHDRFLLRHLVSPMTRGAAAAFLQDLLARPSVPDEPFDLDTDSEEAILTEEHIKIAQRLASKVTFPDDLQEIMIDLRDFMAENDCVISDRRLAKAALLIRLAACTAGATTVSESDLMLLQYMFWEKEKDQIDAIKRFLLERVKGRRTAGSSATDLDAMTHMLTMVKFKMGPAMRMPQSPQFAQAEQAATTLVQATIDCYRSETQAQRRRSLESDKASGSDAAKDFRNFWVDEGDSLSVEGEESKPMDLNALEALLQSAWELDLALQLSEERRKASLAILIGGPEVVMAK